MKERLLPDDLNRTILKKKPPPCPGSGFIIVEFLNF